MKHYYASPRIIYTWNDASISCQSVGMQLAYIECNEELDNFDQMAIRNNKLFRSPVFIDGKNLTENQEPEWCFEYAIYRRKNSMNQISCNGDERSFVCEDVEVADSFDDSHQEKQIQRTSLDVKGTFFSHVGDYGNRTNF